MKFKEYLNNEQNNDQSVNESALNESSVENFGNSVRQAFKNNPKESMSLIVILEDLMNADNSKGTEDTVIDSWGVFNIVVTKNGGLEITIDKVMVTSDIGQEKLGSVTFYVDASKGRGKMYTAGW
jgi:hypothetical protein